jgi:hypothetical protein
MLDSFRIMGSNNRRTKRAALGYARSVGLGSLSRLFDLGTFERVRRRSLRQLGDECLILCRSVFRRSRFCDLGQGRIIAHILAGHVYYSLRSD